MNYELNVGYFYPELLNLYGDRGNITVFVQRCRWRGINVKVIEYAFGEALPSVTDGDYPDLIFMGGGPDSSQIMVAGDLQRKAAWFLNYAHRGGVGLFICGAYQLMGHYYQDAEGGKIPGISLFDFFTRHFGKDEPRCIGNVIVEPSPALKSSALTLLASRYSPTIDFVGFENHGGRTYLGKEATPLGKIIRGFGNNGEDGTEGAFFQNCFGTYLHGPLLPKNPHLADLLILKALRRKYLESVILSPLDDILEWQAHKVARDLK